MLRNHHRTPNDPSGSSPPHQGITHANQLKDKWLNFLSRAEAASCPAPDGGAFSVLQLNCHVSKSVTLHLLNAADQFEFLALQEPWINPFTLRPPEHPAWQAFAPFKHSPNNWSSRHKAIFYVKRSIPSSQICLLEGGSQCIVEIELVSGPARMRLVNVYNPTPSFSSIPTLAKWMVTLNTRSRPTWILTDSNLHHPHWNPPGCNQREPEAASMLSTLAAAGFRFFL